MVTKQASRSATSGPTGCWVLAAPDTVSLGRAAAVPLLRPPQGKAVPRLSENQGLRSPPALAGLTRGLPSKACQWHQHSVSSSPVSLSFCVEATRA